MLKVYYQATDLKSMNIYKQSNVHVQVKASGFYFPLRGEKCPSTEQKITVHTVEK